MPDQKSARRTRSLAKGALTGLVGGLAAAFVMDRFQAAVTAMSSSDGGDAEPATEQAADAIARRIVGHEVSKAAKPAAGQAVHYALGAALGASYGVAAELAPVVTAGFGSAYGVAVAAVMDEAVVPAAGLGDVPWKTPASTHAYTIASHVVFGTALESVRRLLRSAR